MFDRFKRLWSLSRKDPKIFENLTSDLIDNLPDAPDGKAEFISEGSQEDYEEMLKEDKGLRGWYNRIKNL